MLDEILDLEVQERSGLSGIVQLNTRLVLTIANLLSSSRSKDIRLLFQMRWLPSYSRTGSDHFQKRRLTPNAFSGTALSLAHPECSITGMTIHHIRIKIKTRNDGSSRDTVSVATQFRIFAGENSFCVPSFWQRVFSQSCTSCADNGFFMAFLSSHPS